MTNTMRLIFLDFDSVLHEARGDLEEEQFFQWVPVLAKLIAPHPDVYVVVPSSWRHMHTPEELRGFMHELAGRYLGAVPPGPRERSIREYLRLVPQVREYIAIDDAPEEFSRIRGRRLLVCDSRTGLSAPYVRQRLAEWLDGAGQEGRRVRAR